MVGFVECFSEQQCKEYGKNHTCYVQAEHNQGCIFGEERSGYHDIDRKSCGTGHEWNDEHGYKAVSFVFQYPCGHDCRDIATESHDERYETFTMQTYGMHKPLHKMGNSFHIAGFFHERNEEEQYQDIRQKDDDASHSPYYALNHKIIEKALRYGSFGKGRKNSHSLFHQFHGIVSQIEGTEERKPNNEKENDIPEYGV